VLEVAEDEAGAEVSLDGAFIDDHRVTAAHMQL
jgi:hypothetical protein